MRYALPLKAALALALLAGCDDGSGSPEAANQDATVPQQDMTVVPDTLAIEVDTPTEGAFVKARVEVAGRLVGIAAADAPQVKLNGEDAEMNGLEFSGTVRLDPGPQTIVVTAADKSAEVAVVVDDEPPRIDITSPDRGTYSEAGQGDLEFTIVDDLALDTVFAAGAEIDAARAPDFVTETIYAEGLNILRVEATDAAGNTAREAVSVLHGELRDPDAPIASAIRAHIGTRGLDAIGRVAAKLLGEQDLTSLIPAIGDAGGFAVEISEIGYREPVEIAITPVPEELQVTVTLNALTVALTLAINENSIYDVGVGAARVEVSAVIRPRVVDGHLEVDIDDISVMFFDLDFRFGGVPEFENDPELGQGLLEEILGDVVSEVVRQQVPDLLGGLLGFLEDPIPLSLLSAELQLNLTPNVVVVSERGLSVRVDVQVALLNPPAEAPPVPGYPGRDPMWDGVPTTEEFGLAVDDDLFNCLLYQVWRSGALFPVIDQELVQSSGSTLRFVTSFFGQLVARARPDVPANAPLRVATRLPLPIVAGVNKGMDGVGLNVGIGDLFLDISTDDADNRALLSGAASIVVTGELGVDTTDGLKLNLEIGELDPAFDVLDEDLRGKPEAQIESQMSELLAVLGPTIGDLVGGFELPSIDLVTITDVTLDAGGPAGDFLFVIATITE